MFELPHSVPACAVTYLEAGLAVGGKGSTKDGSCSKTCLIVEMRTYLFSRIAGSVPLTQESFLKMQRWRRKSPAHMDSYSLLGRSSTEQHIRRKPSKI